MCSHYADKKLKGLRHEQQDSLRQQEILEQHDESSLLLPGNKNPSL